MEKKIKLTFKQEQILSIVVLGLKDQLIAETMGISVRTVQNHLANIYAKTQTASRVEAVLVYINADFGILRRNSGRRKKQYYRRKRRVNTAS